MAEIQDRYSKVARRWGQARFGHDMYEAQEQGYAQGLADADAQLVEWFDKGCPGLDREKFVAFGPVGMVTAMRQAVERGDPWRDDVLEEMEEVVDDGG